MQIEKILFGLNNNSIDLLVSDDTFYHYNNIGISKSWYRITGNSPVPIFLITHDYLDKHSHLYKRNV
jgi:hypothetical protein